MSKPYAALPSAELPVEWKELSTPPLEDVAKVLEEGLKDNYLNVEVSVSNCPDMTKAPFHLAAPGLCGNPRLLDIGGVPYLIPLVQRERLYDMKDYPKVTDLKEGLVIGAGAAPWTYLQRNAEMMPNLFVQSDGSVNQRTHISRTHDDDGRYEQLKLPAEETKMSLLGNLFVSEGKPGKVLRVKVSKRTGEENFVTCMRKTLLARYPAEAIGLGGAFLMPTGKAKIHVMPDFSACPLNTDADVEKWLNFYEMAGPMVFLSVFISQDPGLDLRVEHTHGFSSHGDAGHYHYDLVPDEAEYVGYFNIAEKCYRVDRPKETHQVGRD